MNLLVKIATTIEVIAFLVSLVTWYKYKHSVLKYFPVYLGLIAVLEMYCMFYYKTGNVWLYNILNVFEFNFLAFIFWNYFQPCNRKALCLFLIIYNSVTIGNYLFKVQDFTVEPISHSYVLSSFFLIILILLLFNQILRSNVRFAEIHRNLVFWICLAFLIYLATSLPMLAITSWEDTLGKFRFGLVYLLGIGVLLKNILFIFGFLWSKKTFIY